MATTTSRLGLLLPGPDDEASDDVTGAPDQLNANFSVLDTAVGGTVYNVRHFGAAGDGTTDDTAAIQEALDAANTAGRGYVLIPPGSYRLTGPVIVRSYTTISAYGAYLLGAGTHSLLRNFDAAVDSFATYSGNSYITVQGGVWDNRGQLAATDQMNNAVTFNHCRRITCRDMVIRNVAGYHGIELNSTDGGAIINCRAEGFVDNSTGSTRQFSEAFQIDVAASGSSTIGLFDNTPSRDILILGCSAGPAVDGSGLGSWGALAGSHTTPVGGFYDSIRVIACTLHSGSLLYGVHAQAWRDSVIADCTFVDTGGTSIFAESGSTGLVIRGNRIRSAGSNAINATSQPGVLIDGNQIVGTDTNYGIFVSNSANSKVTGNRIEAATTAGIRISGTSTGCLITGNQVRAAGVTTNGVSFASGTPTGCIVAGNDLSANSWSGATAIVVSTAAPRTTHAGGTSVPGDNWI